MSTESQGEFPKVSNERARLESLLRIAAEQWPHKSPEDREHERRFIARDMAADGSVQDRARRCGA